MTATSKADSTTPMSPALAALAAEVERNPTDLVAKITLASALEQAGEVTQAVALYKEVVAQDRAGTYGAVAHKALATLEKAQPVEVLTALQTAETPKLNFADVRRSLRQAWENLNLRTKLAILLMSTAAIPVIIVTLAIDNVTTKLLLTTYESKVEQNLSILEEEVEKSQENNQVVAATIAKSVATIGIDLGNPKQVLAQRQLLTNLVVDSLDDRFGQNFHIITDAKGRTVAQYIQTLDEDFSRYPTLPPNNKPVTKQRYRLLSLPTGIALGDIPIVKNALDSGRSLAGIELLNAEFMQRLGLERQASIGVRQPRIQGLPTPKQPALPGTYNIDSGKAGLMIMAVQPIQVNGRQVGTAMVGTLVNRMSTIVDEVKEEHGIATATLFAQDWRVSTNVPYIDSKTRAIGTRASREVAESVLQRGETFIGEANIIGVNYLTGYAPLYNHQKQLNPSLAQPVGMFYVGEPATQFDQVLNNLRLTGYGIGGGMLLLAGIIAIPIANSLSRPLRRLAGFAQQVADGKQSIRLEETERQDEIGILSRQLNGMTASLEKNLVAVQQQETLQRQGKERLQQGMMNLLLEIEGASQGNLTVRAKVREGEMGSIADAFNTVIANLRQIVIQVQTAASRVQTGADVSEASVQKLAKEASNQAKVVDGALNSVTEMSESIESVAASAQQAAGIARQALVAATTGDQTMDQTVGSMQTIRSSVAETTKKAKRLAESSQEISKIVSIISGISEKTNLLAFNASIEAARAGENGQGFRIVADEVRRLAERVTDSTKEIEQLVSTIQQETSDVLQTMEASNTQVVTGTQLVAKTKITLQELAEISKEINQLLQSISVSTVSQAENSRTVNQTMQAVAAIAQTTSAESAAVLSSLQALVEVAQDLQSSVSRFQVEQ